MSRLYARVFTQILDSSLSENWMARHVFEDMFKLADDGVLDITREAFARRTNVPLDVINDAIAYLESPDPKSRDSQHQGRRILRIDEHRDWGWVIVNWAKYEEIKNVEGKRELVAQRVKKHRLKEKSPTPSKEQELKRDIDIDIEEKRLVTPSNAEALQSVTERYSLSGGCKAEDAAIPTLEEIKTYGSLNNVTPEICKKFWEHYSENNSWLNQFNKLINWKLKLVKWRENERSMVAGKPSKPQPIDASGRYKGEDGLIRLPNGVIDWFNQGRELTVAEKARMKREYM